MTRLLLDFAGVDGLMNNAQRSQSGISVGGAFGALDAAFADFGAFGAFDALDGASYNYGAFGGFGAFGAPTLIPVGAIWERCERSGLNTY